MPVLGADVPLDTPPSLVALPRVLALIPWDPVERLSICSWNVVCRGAGILYIFSISQTYYVDGAKFVDQRFLGGGN